MRKKYILSVAILLLSVIAIAQQSSNVTVVEPIKNEKWWGVLSGEGSKMPFVDAQIIDISKTNESNQAASILLSSAGRYIWSSKPFTVEFSEEGVPTITSKYENVAVVKAGKTLREAYLAMSQKYFVNDKISRIDAVLQMPIITISENKTQADVITLCKTLKIKDFGSNIIALNPSWQRYNGALDFDHTSYPSPKEMISEIHSAGGKVMVWVSPFVSADSPTYRDLSKKGYLLLDSSTKRPKLIEWSGGVSAAYDFTNPEASKFFIDKLSKLKSTYSIDGFRFAEGDIDYYATNVKSFLNTATATTHTQAWNNIASNFSMSQIKSSFNSQNLMLAHQLNDAGCTWESIQSIIPNLMAASLMGYPYISVGVENVSDIAPIDEPLIVRLAQLEAANPIMNLPEVITSLSQENIIAFRKATLLHEKFSSYISELSKETSEIGAPIIRTMEYEFPGKSFSDCKDQFMLGTRYLIAPILTKDGKRMVRLPNGRWQDDLGNIYRGPRVISISASLDRLPYFEYLKSESILKKVFKKK